MQLKNKYVISYATIIISYDFNQCRQVLIGMLICLTFFFFFAFKHYF